MYSNLVKHRRAKVKKVVKRDKSYFTVEKIFFWGQTGCQYTYII